MHTSQITSARSGVRVSQRPLTLALALALGLGSAPLASLAATISVSNTGDASSPSTCTLRQAIVSMNTGSVSGTGCNYRDAAFGTNDTIDFATLPTDGSATITLADSPANHLAISAANLTIDATANGQVTIQRPSGAANNFRIMYDNAPAGGSLTLSHIAVSNGRSYYAPYCNGKKGGGGICITQADLTLTNSTVSGNYAYGYAGGIFSRSGNVTLTNSTISNNTSSKFAGGIYVFNKELTLTNSTLSGNSVNGSPYSYGGGIFSQSANVTLTNSTVSGNSARYVGGIWSWTGNVTLTNSTLSGNAGTSTSNRSIGNAGGIWAASGNVALTNSTVSGNSAGNFSGGIFGGGGGIPNPVQAINSIVAGNSAPGGDMNAALTAGSKNNITSGDPKLAALADNGGPTKTMLPQAGSPAIDTGDQATCNAAPVSYKDQRGVLRFQGVQCDIGAVELGAIPTVDPNRLFTNWRSEIVGGNGYTSGGGYAIGDNFSNQEAWHVTDITVYIASYPFVVTDPNAGWRYALFTAAGTQVVAPTGATLTFTSLESYPDFSGAEVYQGVISGLNISLLPGEYQLRFTCDNSQGVYPAYGSSISSQTLSPGFFQLTGSGSDPLLSTNVTQRSQEWAFDLSGTVLPIFKDGFEGP
jgi:hypothetical protein